MSNEPITITDTATPYLNFIAETKPDWMRKALKSTGWMMQKKLSRAFGREHLGDVNILTSWHRLDGPHLSQHSVRNFAKLIKAGAEQNEKPGAQNREMPYLIWALAPGQSATVL